MASKTKTKKRDEEEEDTTPEESPGALSGLNGMWNKVKGLFDFDFGSIFMIAIVAIGAFFIAGTDWGKEMLAKLPDGIGDKITGFIGKAKAYIANLLPESLRSAIPGMDDAFDKEIDRYNAAEVRELVKGKFPPAMMDVILKDDATWTSFKTTVRAANGGKISGEDSFTSPATLVALMTTKDPKVISIRDGLVGLAQNKKDSAADPAVKEKITTAMNGIMNDPKLLGTLLSPANRATTVGLLTQLARDENGKPLISPVTLNSLLANPTFFAADGTPTEQGSALLAKAMANPQAAAQQVLGSIPNDPAKQKEALETLILPEFGTKMGEANITPFRQAFGDQGTLDFAKFYLQQGDAPTDPKALSDYNETVAAYALRPEHIMQTKQFADNVVKQGKLDQLPEPLQAPLQFLQTLTPEAVRCIGCGIEKGVTVTELKSLSDIATSRDHSRPVNMILAMADRTNRDVLRKWGADNVATFVASQMPQAPAVLTGKNITTLLDAMDKIGNSAENREHSEDRLAVLGAFVAYATVKEADPKKRAEQQRAAFKDVPPEKIAAFFQVKANEEALDHLLTHLDLTGREAQMAKALHTSLYGLIPVMATTEGAAFVEEKLLQQESLTDYTTLRNHPDFTGEVERIALWSKGGVIRENRDALVGLSKSLMAIQVDEAAQIHAPSIKSQVAMVTTPPIANR